MKRLLSSLLALCLFCSLFVTQVSALEYEPTIEDQAFPIAQALNEAGLFAGTGIDAKGKPIFALEETATRAQAIVMLVRILGKEAEAAQAPASPFTDVPDWAKPHVNYAYTNGLTGGIADTLFGSYNSISNTEYLTFCLRALGYNDSEFKWDEAYKFAQTIGLIEKGEYENRNETFKRADVVLITYSTMKSTVKNSSQTLAEVQGITLKDVQRGTTPYWRPSLEECIPERYLGIVDTSDESLNRLGNDGKIHFREGFGSKIWSNLINQYDSNLTPLENMKKFSEMVNGMNSTCTETVFTTYNDGSGNVEFNIDHQGWGRLQTWSYNVSEQGYSLGGSIATTWGWTDSKYYNQNDYGRLYHKYVLAFFDYDMAVRVQAMVTDYHMNTDSRIEDVEDGVDEFGNPNYRRVYHGSQYLIDEQFVNKYGLTYIDGGNGGIWTDYVIVSNGKMTVRLDYCRPGAKFTNDSAITISWK